MNNTITQSGRSMVEVMGYMAAVMAVIAGVSKIITGSYNQYKLSKASIQVSDLASAIVKASTIDSDYEHTIDSIKTGTTEGRRLLPNSFKMGQNNKIYHAFGGEVELGSKEGRFSIRFNNLTREQCIELGMKEWINNKIVDLYSIYINNNQWTWPIYAGIASGISSLPTKRSALAGKDLNDDGQCDKPGKGNFIMWVFN